ncbi:MAG: peptidylprolyl isomerase [Phycisphaerae bacterium]|nr:peptidylprolyl isomerase [Phycisphaerae bacterium]
MTKRCTCARGERRVLGRAAAWLGAVGVLGVTGWGQITPTRTYYTVGGRVEVAVRDPGPDPKEPAGESVRPAEAAPGAALEIALHRSGEAAAIETASVLAGRVDLAALFPRLWKGEKPELLRAQLRRAGVAVGPPVVLQPLTAPARATPLDPSGVRQRFTPGAPAYFGGLRVYVDKQVVLVTTLGGMQIELAPEAAPNTAWNFRQLVEGGFYAGLTFHRVIGGDTPETGYVAQAGDPLGTGEGGPGYAIDLEPSTMLHDVGVVSMARLPAPDTAGSQFFICLSRARCVPLDGGYAAFGRVVKGMEVVRAIAAAPTDARERPLTPIVITAAGLVDAPPIRADGESAVPAAGDGGGKEDVGR